MKRRMRGKWDAEGEKGERETPAWSKRVCNYTSLGWRGWGLRRQKVVGETSVDLLVVERRTCDWRGEGPKERGGTDCKVIFSRSACNSSYPQIAHCHAALIRYPVLGRPKAKKKRNGRINRGWDVNTKDKVLLKGTFCIAFY